MNKEVFMFLRKRNAFLCLMVAAAMLLIQCGGSGSSNNLSQSQAQAVTAEVTQAVAQALANAVPSGAAAARGVRPRLSTVVRGIRADQLSGCTPSGTGEICNWPISYDGTCSQGGTIAVVGDIDATLDSNGSGSVSSQLTATPANCSVSSLVLNGDPNIGIGLNMSFTDSALVFPITLTEDGGVSYGPNPSGSCTFNVKFTITSETTCTITGTACGQSVNGSC